MYKTTISILALSVIASTLAAQSSSVTVSGLYVYPDADSSIEANLDASADLDDAPGLSIEWRTSQFADAPFTLGLEYMYFGTEADISGNLTNEDANFVNQTFGTTFAAGDTELKEEYDVHGGMLNLGYDIAVTDKITAYLGVGVGFAHFNQELSLKNAGQSVSGDDSDVVFAYQFKAGARYALNDAWAITGGVRYIGFDDPEFKYGDTTLSGDVSALAVELGLSCSF